MDVYIIYYIYIIYYTLQYIIINGDISYILYMYTLYILEIVAKTICYTTYNLILLGHI